MDEITAKVKMQELVQALVANGYFVMTNNDWAALLTDDKKAGVEYRVDVSFTIGSIFLGDEFMIRTRIKVYQDFGGGETRTLEETTNKADVSNIIEFISNVKKRMQLCKEVKPSN